MTEENSDQIEEPQEVVQEANIEPEQDNREEPAEQEVKRGRGRPKGALGKKTKTEQEQRNENFILDVSFDEKPSRKRVKKIKEEEPLSPIIEEPIPKPKRKVAMKKNSEAPPQEEPMTYLEVLTRGLRAAESQHKARKVATYDNFFRY
jgi:hypothetical protein